MMLRLILALTWDFIKVLENIIGKSVNLKFSEMQTGDTLKTFANIEELSKKTGFKPKIKLEEGLGKFIEWYLKFYQN